MLRHLLGKRCTVPDTQQAVLLWNSILQDCSSAGQQEAVLWLFRDMLSAGVRPNASTLPSPVRSCARLAKAPLGQTIHALARKSGCEPDPFVASAIVHMYAQCGRIDDAHQMFHEIPQRNVVSWTTMVQGYARIGRVEDAFALFKLMQSEDGVRPNVVSLISLIPACRRIGDGECVHACVVKLGLDSHSLMGTSLADMYLKCRDVEGASRIFNTLEDKNSVSWLVMVSGLAKVGRLADAVSMVIRMREFDVSLDSIASVDMLSACAHCGDGELGMWVHCLLLKTGLECDEYVGSGLISMYSSCGLLNVARVVFDHMPRRNLVVWNSIMHSYARAGSLKDAVMLFYQLKLGGLSPDSISIRSLLSSASLIAANHFGKCIHGYAIKDGLDLAVDTINSLVDFYAKAGDLQDAECLFSTMKDEGDSASWNCMIRAYLENGYPKQAVRIFSKMISVCVPPDSVTLSSVLKVSACNGDILNGRCLHALATKLVLSWDHFVGTSLVDMYAKCGEISSAYQIFAEMPDQDVVAWNAMIAGFCQHGFANEALVLFNWMNADDSSTLQPDFITVASVVSAIAHSGSLEQGRQLHAYIVKKAFQRNITVGNATITMYSNCGLVEDAWSIFQRMPQKDSTSWTAMIAGYGMNGFGRDAISLFEKMKKESDFAPSDITFLELLSACSHAGLLKEGLSYFETMKSIYKILPSTQHYACIVDLLGRQGHIYEAYLLIRSMADAASVLPDAAVWGAFLSACRIHGEVKLGEIAAAEIMRLEPTDSDYEVLLSNLYAATGRWNDVANVRCAVDLGSSMKAPGWSCIEVRN